MCSLTRRGDREGDWLRLDKSDRAGMRGGKSAGQTGPSAYRKPEPRRVRLRSIDGGAMIARDAASHNFELRDKVPTARGTDPPYPIVGDAFTPASPLKRPPGYVVLDALAGEDGVSS